MSRYTYIKLIIVLLISFVGSAFRGATAAEIRLAELLEFAGSVIEGKVIKIDRQAYDSTARKPATIVNIQIIDRLDSSKTRNSVRFVLPIGEYPDGTYGYSPHAPEFVLGAEYIIVLKSGEWTITPVVGGSKGLFRKVRSAFGNFYVTTDGFAVATIEDGELVIGPRLSLPDEMLVANNERGENFSLIETVRENGKAVNRLINSDILISNLALCQTCIRASEFKSRIIDMLNIIDSALPGRIDEKYADIVISPSSDEPNNDRIIRGTNDLSD